MKIFSVVALFLLFFLIQASLSEKSCTQNTHVTKEVLGGIKERGRWFVLFYRGFEEDSDKAFAVVDEVLSLKDTQEVDFGVLKADCREDKDGLCEGVTIPSLHFFHNGQSFVYPGNWDAQEIVDYARQGKYDTSNQERFLDPIGEGIHTLTSKNFDQETLNGAWLIQVYAPWCRYCKELSPVWEELAEKLVSQNVKLGKIDGTIESRLADRLEVRGYPAIYYVKGGQKREYPGNAKRDLASLLAFVYAGFKESSETPVLREQSDEEEVDSDLPSKVVTLTDADFFEKTKEGVWLVEFYAPWCGHCKKLTPTWERVAHKADGKFNVAKLDATENERTSTAFGIRGFPTIKLLKDGKQYKFAGQRTTDAFLEFVEHQYQDIEPTDIPKGFDGEPSRDEL